MVETPDKIPGWSFNHTGGISRPCNWKKCWYGDTDAHGTPFLIQLADDSLWVVQHPPMEVVSWGEGPPVDTSDPAFVGPFDDFNVALATLSLIAP